MKNIKKLSGIQIAISILNLILDVFRQYFKWLVDMMGTVGEQSIQSNCDINLSGVLDAVPAGIIILNSCGDIIENNIASDQLLGSGLKGRSWREILNACFIRQSDDGHEISTKGGRRLLVSTTALGDQHEGQIILLSDQTETRKLQDIINQQKRLSALGQMVSALAHQIRTPLSAALLYASHLCDPSMAEQKRMEFSHKLRSRLLHLERQVQDMLLFVKGELPLNDSISSKQFIAELREATEFSIQACGAKLKLSNYLPSGSFKCNKDALINAVLNLVNNAIQSYESTDGKAQSKIERFRLIEIKCCESGGIISIKVRDYGCGIQPEIMQRLVNPFVTTKAQGTGLGLAVIRAVAKAHGGEFILENKNPGVLAEIKIPMRTQDISKTA